MANRTHLVEDPGGTYSGYTAYYSVRFGKNTTGVVQIDITGTCSVSIKGRLHDHAEWIQIRAATASEIQSLTLPNYIKIDVTGTGSAKVYIGEAS